MAYHVLQTSGTLLGKFDMFHRSFKMTPVPANESYFGSFSFPLFEWPLTALMATHFHLLPLKTSFNCPPYTRRDVLLEIRSSLFDLVPFSFNNTVAHCTSRYGKAGPGLFAEIAFKPNQANFTCTRLCHINAKSYTTSFSLRFHT